MAGRSPQESEAVIAQPLWALTGFEALARIEDALCRGAVSREPATAEGLALAGVRSASLGAGARGPAAGISLPDVSCVHHVDGTPGRALAGSFELRAASAQEAVDHCVLAHLLSRALRRPGLCSLPSDLGRDLGLVRLPGRELMVDLLEAEPEPTEGAPDAVRILELAREAARKVGARLGRPLDLIDYQGNAEASLVLVASGADVASIQRVSRVLSEVGVPVGALSVKLVRPFPEALVRDALSSARTVLVVEDPARGELLAQTRAGAGEKATVHPANPASPAALTEALAEHLPKRALKAVQRAPAEAPLGRRVVVAPAGAWGDETARQVVAAVGHVGPVRLAPRTRHHLGAAVLVWGTESIPESGQDLLLASHPALLEPRGALALLRAGGAIVVLSDASSSEEMARLLSPETRAFLREREVRVHWMGHPEGDEGEGAAETDRAASLALAGGALRVLCEETVPIVTERLEGSGRAEAARWLRSGAEGIRVLDAEALDPARHVEEVDFRRAPTLPQMALPVDDPEARVHWAESIRRFHWTGRGAFRSASGLPVRPAALESLAADLRSRSSHPFVLVQSDDPESPVAARSLRDVLVETIEAPALADNLDRLVFLAARLLSRRSAPADVASLLSDAGKRMIPELGLVKEAEQPAVEALARLTEKLPRGPLMDLRGDTPVRLYLEVLDGVRAPARRRFEAELERLREKLRDLLELDRMGSSEGRGPDTLAATLGSSATNYLDPKALSQTLGVARSSEALGPDRTARIESALAAIERYCEGRDRPPPVVVLRPPDIDFVLPCEEQQEHPDPLTAAVGMFDGLALRMVDLFRAARIARLEVAGHYRRDLHDEALEEMDWEALTAEELTLVPAVAVVTTGRRLREHDQGALSELLRSSRPVHVIVHDEVAPEDEAEDLSRFHLDLGHLVVAHREACAVGSTLARPESLVDGLTRIVRALRPGVALVRLPARHPAAWRGLLAEAGLHGRACPDFRYDPDAGASWAERFDLEGNPEPGRPWPLHRVTFLEDGEEKNLEVAFTFADAVALEPAYLRHLRIIPRAAWGDEQLPLADYVEQFDPEGQETSIPYVWVIDEEEILQRAVVTRELAMACRDRARGWRMLQELAGYQNVFAERAAAIARDEMHAAADARQAELEQAHLDEESIERVARALMSPEGVSIAPTDALAPVAPRAPEPAPVEARAEAAAPAPAAAEEPAEEEEALSFDEPFIDSPLCTTCNECTNINGQLFKYNADKQAFIADAAAGTFEELVKAAELCPALCIHPGKPRADDPTGTPEMIERAAKFN
jgi:hypothetical protein